MKGSVFTGRRVTIPAGAPVASRNLDGATHTVAADDGTFDSGDIAAGDSWSHRFDTPGTYTDHCTPHAYEDDGNGRAWWRP